MNDHKSVTIVIIEDDEGHARLIEKNIRRAGILNDIKHFTDGTTALDYLYNHKEGPGLNGPALILLDLNLPDMSGIDILAKIKAEGSSVKRTPVVVLTTTDDKVEVPLQAADLLAWLIRRDGEAPLAPPYEALLDKIVIPGVHRAQVIGRDVLERIGQGFADIPLASGIDKKSWKDLAALFESGVAKQVNDAVRRAGLYPPT